MNSEYEFAEVISRTIMAIDDFCQCSYKIAPEKCMNFILAFLQDMDQLVLGLEPKEVKRVKKMLAKMLEALQNSDYVLVRDYMTYEIKPFIQRVEKKMNF